MQFSIEHDLDKNSNKLLIILVFADIVFIVLHTLHHDTGLLPSSLFSLAQERGYGEMYQYIKEFWIVVLLFILAITRLNFLYVAWALLFVYLLLDDSFQIHERGGVFLANYLNLEPKYGLQAEEFGQLFISIFFGGFFLAIIGVSHYLSNVSDRIISKYLFIMLIILIFFWNNSRYDSSVDIPF